MSAPPSASPVAPSAAIKMSSQAHLPARGIQELYQFLIYILIYRKVLSLTHIRIDARSDASKRRRLQ
jgi:hypothetical protein